MDTEVSRMYDESFLLAAEAMLAMDDEVEPDERLEIVREFMDD